MSSSASSVDARCLHRLSLRAFDESRVRITRPDRDAQIQTCALDDQLEARTNLQRFDRTHHALCLRRNRVRSWIRNATRSRRLIHEFQVREHPSNLRARHKAASLSKHTPCTLIGECDTQPISKRSWSCDSPTDLVNE